jgi:hypothetical protein
VSGILTVRVELESGEVIQDQTFPIGNGVVSRISKDFTNADGEKGEIVFEFDPPLIIPEGPGE